MYKNLLKMWVRRWTRGSYAWFINQEVEPQLTCCIRRLVPLASRRTS